MGNRWGDSGNSPKQLQNHCRWWLQPWNLKTLTPWKETYDLHRQHIQKQRHYFANKGLSIQSYAFSSGHVWMWELDCEESWAPKNWCFWTVVMEKTLESPLDCKEIQPVHPKAHQSWVFTGRTDAEAETPILWPPHAKSWLIAKDPDAGRDWGQKEKGMMQDEMAGWHHWLDGHEFEWTPGVGDGQGGLACWDSWGCKQLDTTERLNWTELNWNIIFNIEYFSVHRNLNLNRSHLASYYLKTKTYIETQINLDGWIEKVFHLKLKTNKFFFSSSNLFMTGVPDRVGFVSQGHDKS